MRLDDFNVSSIKTANVDEVSWIALKTLLQSAMELLQIATA